MRGRGGEGRRGGGVRGGEGGVGMQHTGHGHSKDFDGRLGFKQAVERSGHQVELERVGHVRAAQESRNEIGRGRESIGRAAYDLQALVKFCALCSKAGQPIVRETSDAVRELHFLA